MDKSKEDYLMETGIDLSADYGEEEKEEYINWLEIQYDAQKFMQALLKKIFISRHKEIEK